MRKSIAILISVFVISIGHLTWAEEKGGIEELKKELGQETEKDKKFRLTPEQFDEKHKTKRKILSPEEFEKKYKLTAEEKLKIEWDEAIELTAEEKAKIEARREAERQQRLSKFKKTLKEVGRFQATPLMSNAIFILDTKEGHLWIWLQQQDEEGRREHLLLYQGQVLPGSYMSERISPASD